MNTSAMARRLTLWAAILMSTLLLAAFAWLLPPLPAGMEPPIFAPMLGALAAVVAVFSFVLPAMSTRIAMQRLASQVREEAFGGSRSRVLQLSTAAFERLMMSTLPAFIMSIALSEVSSLFGLVLNRLGAPITTSIPFFAAGTLLVAIRFPSRSAALARIGRTLGARVVVDG
jgi:hypothetical protein